MINQFSIVGRILTDFEIEFDYIKLEIESRREKMFYIDEKDGKYKDKKTQLFKTTSTIYIPNDIKQSTKYFKKGYLLGFRGYVDRNKLIVDNITYCGKQEEKTEINKVIQNEQLNLFDVREVKG